MALRDSGLSPAAPHLGQGSVARGQRGEEAAAAYRDISKRLLCTRSERLCTSFYIVNNNPKSQIEKEKENDALPWRCVGHRRRVRYVEALGVMKHRLLMITMITKMMMMMMMRCATDH